MGAHIEVRRSEPYSELVGVRLTPAQLRRLHRLAIRHGATVSGVLRAMIEQVPDVGPQAQ